MKKLAGLVLMALLLTACGGGSDTEKTGKAESEKDKDGNYATAEVTLKGDSVSAIKLDEVKGGKSKTELGADYAMKDASKIKKEWNEQVKFLEDYIVKNGIDKVELTEKGTPKNDDVLAGCTINIKTMMDTATAAKDKAE